MENLLSLGRAILYSLPGIKTELIDGRLEKIDELLGNENDEIDYFCFFISSGADGALTMDECFKIFIATNDAFYHYDGHDYHVQSGRYLLHQFSKKLGPAQAHEALEILLLLNGNGGNGRYQELEALVNDKPNL